MFEEQWPLDFEEAGLVLGRKGFGLLCCCSTGASGPHCYWKSPQAFSSCFSAAGSDCVGCDESGWSCKITIRIGSVNGGNIVQ